MYLAHVRREAVEELRHRKMLQITALYANTNYDSKEVNREEIVKSMEDQFEEAINGIYGWQEPAIDLSQNPFFAAIRLPKVEDFDPEELRKAGLANIFSSGPPPVPTPQPEPMPDPDIDQPW